LHRHIELHCIFRTGRGVVEGLLVVPARWSTAATAPQGQLAAASLLVSIPVVITAGAVKG
jgi:hypothetical protein